MTTKTAAKTKRRGPGRPKNPIPRAKLLAEARAAFAVDGFAGASMNDIAARCGIRKSSLFHRFGTKDQLYVEVFTEIMSEFEGLLQQVMTPESDFLAQLDRLGELLTAHLAAHPHTARLVMRELVGGGPVATGPGQEILVQILQATALFLRGGMETGAVPKQDAMQLALSIIGLHLTYFAVPDFASKGVGGPIFEEAQILARQQAVRVQVRGLVGVPAIG